MSDTQPDPYEGQRPGAPQDPTPQTEAGAEESTRILPLNDQPEESLPVGPEAAPAVEAAAAQDRTAPMSPIPDEGATRTPLVPESTPTAAAAAPAEVQAPRDAQAFRGAQTSAEAQAPRAWMPPAAPARGPQGPSAWTGAPEAAQQAASTLIAPRSEKKAKRGPSWFALIVSMILTAAITLSASWALMQTRSAARSVPVPSTSQGATTVTPVTSSGDSPDWQAVASAVSPAVVTIGVQSSSSSGVGSGVVYNANGDIVTNYHVISPALDGQGKITVTLADSRLYEAEIVGTDQTTDLAVIRLTNPPADLTVATFGSSSDLAVGQEVMAVGAPLGLSNTVTTGVISALNRPVEVSNTDSGSTPSDPNDPFGQLPQLQNRSTSSSDSVITNAIQVDASINPGNSGGPLFDSSGRVIGINSSIASNSGSSGQAGSIGLGFAIPVDLVSSVADQLIATGSADHAVLGVTVQSATAELDGAAVAGAKIVDVIAGGGADKAGLKIDDVIVAVDGETVSSSKQLTGYVRRYKGGDEVTVTYVRNGQKYEVSATLTSQQG